MKDWIEELYIQEQLRLKEGAQPPKIPEKKGEKEKEPTRVISEQGAPQFLP